MTQSGEDGREPRRVGFRGHERRRIDRHWKILAIVPVLLLAGTGGYFVARELATPRLPLVGYSFGIDIIDYEADRDYQLTVPIVVWPNETLAPISISGSANVSWVLVDTPYGIGLNISGRGHARLGGRMSGPYVYGNNVTVRERFPASSPGLSMWTNETEPRAGQGEVIGGVWVFASRPVGIDIYLSRGGIAHNAEIAPWEFRPAGGWELVPVGSGIIWDTP